MSKDDTGGKSAKDTHYANLRRAHRDQRRERGEIPTPRDDRRRKPADCAAQCEGVAARPVDLPTTAIV